MKIFAKRRKRTSTSSTPEPRTTNKSDPIVEELLKKNPSEWNAKERRMVKRYQERKAEEGNGMSTEGLIGENTEKLSGGGAATIDKQVPVDSDTTSNERKDEAGNDNKHDTDESSSHISNSDSEGEGSKDEESKLQTVDNPPGGDAPSKEGDKADNDKVHPDHPIWNILNQLNSKQKRTLSRRLERDGNPVLQAVEAEAKQFLGAENNEVASKHTGPNETSIQTTSENNLAPPQKKRKKQIDWSSLTPEERLRREEQRRRQTEAAERRALGGDTTAPGHRRPLNSARRRANRRKPKWKKASHSLDTKNEHNSSGYQFRKHVGEHQPEAEAY
ncbi:hypothetical protein IV203_031457 [Nitzschia inconspicua]|uniref:Uncharacterized protein n=1 Tax=Nitzschia inconspicua TaxID=303405 RepID=A0A9K3Q541_9STRA|nr:hypothetical protein IV203_031457 [Nitzschia inconspicua]